MQTLTDTATLKQATICSVNGCGQPVYARGLCKTHYDRVRESGGFEDHPRVRRSYNGATCAICGEFLSRAKNSARGLCSMHYRRLRKHGDPTITKRAANGAGAIDSQGYRLVTQAGRRDFEHRLVMERARGQRLRTDEHVHHVNGDRLDNRPENLWVLAPAEHTRLHHAARSGMSAHV